MRNGVSAVNFLYYELHDYDQQLPDAVRRGLVPEWPDAVIRECQLPRVRTPTTAACLMAVAAVAGVALVWDGQRATLIGNQLMLQRWERYRPAPMCLAAAVECLLLPTPANTAARDRRVALDRVKRRVGERFPTLLLEGQLQWQSGGLWLGGVVQPPEFYTSGEFCRRLGVPRLFALG